MEGVSLNTSPVNPYTNDVAGSRSRDAQNEGRPPGASEPPAPRVNEGPSTVTTISPQALQLAQQEQAAGNAGGNSPSNSPPPNAGSPPPRNDGQAERDDGQGASPQAVASNDIAPQASSGRAFDDESPNSLLRN